MTNRCRGLLGAVAAQLLPRLGSGAGDQGLENVEDAVDPEAGLLGEVVVPGACRRRATDRQSQEGRELGETLLDEHGFVDVDDVRAVGRSGAGQVTGEAGDVAGVAVQERGRLEALLHAQTAVDGRSEEGDGVRAIVGPAKISRELQLSVSVHHVPSHVKG